MIPRLRWNEKSSHLKYGKLSVYPLVRLNWLWFSFSVYAMYSTHSNSVFVYVLISIRNLHGHLIHSVGIFARNICENFRLKYTFKHSSVFATKKKRMNENTTNKKVSEKKLSLNVRIRAFPWRTLTCLSKHSIKHFIIYGIGEEETESGLLVLRFVLHPAEHC